MSVHLFLAIYIFTFVSLVTKFQINVEIVVRLVTN